MDDALGHSAGSQQVGRTGDGAFQQLGRALAVPGQLTAELLGGLGQRGNEGIIIGRTVNDFCTRQAGRQQQHRVVGGGIAVHRDLVEGRGHNGGERLLQRGRRDLGIGRHKEEHRGHVRVDHAGTLGDGADAHRLAVHRELQRKLLGVSVGGHDGVGGIMAACLIGGQLGGSLGDAPGKRLDAHLLPDDAGGGGQHILGADAECLGHKAAGIPRKLQAVRRAGVGVAAVHNDGLRVAVR